MSEITRNTQLEELQKLVNWIMAECRLAQSFSPERKQLQEWLQETHAAMRVLRYSGK